MYFIYKLEISHNDDILTITNLKDTFSVLLVPYLPGDRLSLMLFVGIRHEVDNELA